MTQEPLFLFTLNCGKKGLALLDSNDPAYRNFADSIYGILPGSRDNVSTIYAFAFEELCSIVEGSFVLLVEKYLSGLSLRLIELLKFKYGNDVDFSVVGTSCIGAIGLIVITPDKTRFSVIRKAGSSCGYLYSSLKGACGLRFKLLKNSLSSIFTIVACHLNANEGLRNWKRRNQDLVTLIRSLDFGDGWGILHPSAHCFIMGDLNYRATGNLPGIVSSEGLTPNSELSTLTSRLLDLQTVNDSDQLPNTSDSTDPLFPTIERDFGSVDELTISRVDKKALWGFEEAKITFRPTYKFFDGQNTYNPKRVPSWCDRILFQSYEKETVSSISSSASTSLLDLSSTTVSRLNSNRVEIVKYGSLPNVTISDHKPVYLIIKVPFDPPKELVIDKHGRLIRENPYGALYLKPTLYDKVVRNISFVADAAIGWTLYCLSTPKTRLALLALIAVGIYFYMFSST